MNHKQTIFNKLNQEREAIYALGDKLFSIPEAGFKEYQTAKIITGYISEKKIAYTDGLALTGIKATVGNDGYHIAVVADMDAVLVNKDDGLEPVHSCGHHIQMAVGLAVLSALNESGAINELGGRVSLIATPAEEFIDLDYRKELVNDGKLRCLSGKQEMIVNGIFDDVDCVLSIHISGDKDYLFDVETTLAGFKVKRAEFFGKGAHAGALAHEGKNALHAAALFIQACSFMLEQFPHKAGIELHPVMTKSSTALNVIPELTVLDSYIRANRIEDLISACEKFDRAAFHSAAALGLESKTKTTPGYMPFVQNSLLCETIYNNMLLHCDKSKINRGAISGASGDIGDLSYLLPAVQFGFSGFKGRIHSDEFEVSDYNHVYINSASVLAGAIIDILSDKSLQPQKNKADYISNKTKYINEWLELKGGNHVNTT